MAGLFEKDLRLLLQRKKLYVVFFLVMFMMSANGGLVIVSYGTMFFGIFAVGVQSYDDYDKSVPFLLTLPVTRKDYVKEKFLFCFGGVLTGWILSLLIAVIVSVLQGSTGELLTEWKEYAAVFFIFWGMISILIPIYLKYDAERGKIILMLIAGGIFGIAAAYVLLAARFEISTSVLTAVVTLPDGIIFVGFIVINLALVLLMYGWSLRVMEKKEFT